MNIKDISENKFCIGCGNCAVANPDVHNLVENELGLIDIESVESDTDEYLNVCPFTQEKLNEDYFNARYEANDSKFEPGVGHYQNIYAGYDVSQGSRVLSSSGGLSTYLLAELFRRGKISKAVVVVSSGEGDARQKYKIISNITDLNTSRKSKYHLVSHHECVKDLLSLDEQEDVAYVGVPCGIKAMKILCENSPKLKKIIKYNISIFCGHQKSHAFSEFVGWQLGVQPEHLQHLDYRVKSPSPDASKYYYEATDKKKAAVKKRVDRLKWMGWDLGLFKPKACDFCDDVAGECADIIFGDAWDKKYAKDYRGTNIVLTRNKELESILLEGREKNSIKLYEEGVEFLFSTQGGNFRNRHEGLISRMRYYDSKDYKYPKKSETRTRRYSHNLERDHIYIARHKISMMSHEAFLEAKKRGNLNVFFELMKPFVHSYNKSNYRFIHRIKSLIKKLY